MLVCAPLGGPHGRNRQEPGALAAQSGDLAALGPLESRRRVVQLVGDTPAMWFGALLPRIHGFVPVPTILEIGPGHGRWTQYLKELAGRLVIVDPH